MAIEASFEEIRALAAANGFVVLGVSDSRPLVEDAERLRDWQARGFAGEMKYMLRSPEMLAAPRRLLQESRTVLLFTVEYSTESHPPFQPGFGRVARYAWGRDYHDVIPEAMSRLAEDLKGRYGPEVQCRYFTDAVPLLERALGARAGLGFVGRNTLLIRPGTGSFMFLAEMLTNLDVTGVPPTSPKGRCGPCSRCTVSCPTSALDGEYRLDARRCISYLSIEKRGILEPAERPLLGEWVFGCDVCQEVCPFNHKVVKVKRRPLRDDFGRDRGAGPLLDLSQILAIRTNREFESRFAGTPLLRARRAGLLRNCAVVAANTRATCTAGSLTEAATADSSPVVRQHCAWALRMLHPHLSGPERTMAVRALAHLERDPIAEVAAEAQLAGIGSL